MHLPKSPSGPFALQTAEATFAVPVIAINNFATVANVTLPGANVGDTILAATGSSIAGNGLFVMGVSATAADKVEVVMGNGQASSSGGTSVTIPFLIARES